MRQRHGTYHYWKNDEFKKHLIDVGFNVLNIKETYTNNWDLLAVVRK